VVARNVFIGLGIGNKLGIKKQKVNYIGEVTTIEGLCQVNFDKLELPALFVPEKFKRIIIARKNYLIF
jgi:hypothetical protein